MAFDLDVHLQVLIHKKTVENRSLVLQQPSMDYNNPKNAWNLEDVSILEIENGCGKHVPFPHRNIYRENSSRYHA